MKHVNRIISFFVMAAVGLLLHLVPGLPTAPLEAMGAAAEKIDESRSGVYHADRWEYRFTITAPGTRSEGTTGELLFDGKPVEEPGAVGDYYHTPWGDIQWVGNPATLRSAHGWMPRALEATGGRALEAPSVVAGPPVLSAMVLVDGEAGAREKVDPWVQAELEKLEVKAYHVERTWFPLSDQAFTVHDTKMYGTLTARLAQPRDAATLSVLLGGTEPARVDLVRKDGTTRLVRHTLSMGIEPFTYYLAFRVDRAAPSWPPPLDVGPAAEGKVVAVKGVYEVVIALPGDLDSGCLWTIKSVVGDGVTAASVKPIGQPQFVPAPAEAGAARTGTFENLLRVVDTGVSVVELEYHRPWQTGVPPEKTFKVTLQVDGLPGDVRVSKPGGKK